MSVQQREASPNVPQPLSRPSSECSIIEQQQIGQQKRPDPSPPASMQAVTTPQHVILQRHPVLWQGLIALKNDQAAVQMHYVSGNRSIAAQALPTLQDGLAATVSALRITQRMRIEHSQLQGLMRKIQSKDDCCILMALPCGRDQADVLRQSNNLKKYFITYLQSKCAAGIVNDPTFGYITHIFPPCSFSDEHLLRTAPEMLHSLVGISHLMVVITTTSNMTTATNNASYS